MPSSQHGFIQLPATWQKQNIKEDGEDKYFPSILTVKKKENYEIPDENYRPDVMTDSGIKDQIIQKALLKISTAYREAVILRDIQELSYEEIAEIMGITVGTVKSRINRGRAQLQKLLIDIYKE